MIMARTHEFTGELVWKKGTEGLARSNHTVTFAGRPPFEVSAAPQYQGDPTRLNPEELFLGALASCQLLTYLALAPRAQVDVVRYEDRATAVLAIVERKMRIQSVLLRPRITIGGGEETAAHALVEKAHEGCFIANSVACEIRLEPTILLAEAAAAG
jgi:organic hydroperoxide reductase OsmC/OhrA